MAEPAEILRDELGIVRQQIIQEQSQLGITDSGRSALSIEIKGSRKIGAVLTSIGYLQTNFDGIGRGPGRMPPISEIEQWGKLDPRPGQTRRQAAFVVARKIGQLGTEIFRGKQGIDMDRITRDSADRLARELADNELIRFQDIFE